MANDFSRVFDLATLDGINGFAIDGVEDGDNAASTLSNAGDINNDGFADLIIGAPFRDLIGGAYLVFGREAGFTTPLNLADLNGENGVYLEGVSAFFFTFGVFGFISPVSTPSFSGISLDAIGDFNNDGIDDIAIGSPGGSTGEISIVYGTEQPFPATLDLDDELTGSNGFEFEEGDEAYKPFGQSVSGIGDFDGDGIDDVLLGAPGFDGEPGEAYVLFGTPETLPDEFSSDDLNGTNGFGIVGETNDQEFGRSVAGLGDFNGDGLNDIAIGAPSSDNPELPTRSYAIFGSNEGYPTQLFVATLDGSNGFAIAGASTADEFGHILSNAGDLNGDGLNDLIVGAPTADANGEDSGRAYVVFGSPNGFPAQLDVATLDGTNGFVIDGLAAGDRLGDTVSQAGDLNADGIADILLSAPESDVNGENSGQAYAIFGSQAPFPASFDLNALDGSNGFIVNGLNPGDEFGESISGIGDFNGDGIDDIALGAPNAATNGSEDTGQAYVIFGRRPTPTVAGDETDNVLTGTDAAEIFEAGAGDDDIEAGGGDDTIAPGGGNDTIDGGDGIDTVRFEGDRASFPIQLRGDVLRVGSNSDVLTNVETLEFTDASIDVTDLQTQLVRVEVGEAIAISLPQPVVPDALTLYDDADDGVTPPDVVLTNAAGKEIAGSIAIDEARTTVQFVPTGGSLVAGDYTLTLPDAADGFAPDATPLDGNGNGEAGGAFQLDFSLDNAGGDRLLSLPDFARAPGQTVQFYNSNLETLSPGLPVTIDNGAQVTAAAFTLTYTPEFLEVSGVVEDSLPEGWTVQFEAIDPVLGTVEIALAGTALAAGETNLLRLDVSVPETATYRETGVLTIASVNLNDGVIAASGDAAIQHVSLLGDANGDREYSLDDAQAIARNAIDLGTGFAAHPRIAPAIVADVTGDGTVSALDASVVAARAAGLNPPELLV
ncbi:MAG: cohesin domain-containing protein [Cyanobacteria bacterium J06639_1]